MSSANGMVTTTVRQQGNEMLKGYSLRNEHRNHVRRKLKMRLRRSALIVVLGTALIAGMYLVMKLVLLVI